MPRTLLAALLLWIVALPCMATVELNGATVAELDSIKGIGPATSRAILAERSRAPFTDWADFMRRVKGVREATAARYSEAGLTVQGVPFPGMVVAAPGGAGVETPRK